MYVIVAVECQRGSQIRSGATNSAECSQGEKGVNESDGKPKERMDSKVSR